MLRKFALLLALGAFSLPLMGCNQEAADETAPAVVPEGGADIDVDAEDLGSDEAMDDSNATTGN